MLNDNLILKWIAAQRNNPIWKPIGIVAALFIVPAFVRFVQVTYQKFGKDLYIIFPYILVFIGLYSGFILYRSLSRKRKFKDSEKKINTLKILARKENDIKKLILITTDLSALMQ